MSIPNITSNMMQLLSYPYLSLKADKSLSTSRKYLSSSSGSPPGYLWYCYCTILINNCCGYFSCDFTIHGTILQLYINLYRLHIGHVIPGCWIIEKLITCFEFVIWGWAKSSIIGVPLCSIFHYCIISQVWMKNL